MEHGYAFFAFQRHGHGESPGDYIGDLEKQQRAANPSARGQASVALHEAYNRDVVGAVEWLMRRPEIDRQRVVMTGVSYGGIQTLLTAGEEKREGWRHAVALNNMLFSASLFTAESGPTRRELLLVDPWEGKELLFEVLSSPVAIRSGENGIVSVLRNVTDLRRATEEIEEKVAA